MSIAAKLEKIYDIKTKIRKATEYFGVDFTDTPFEGYPNKIASIENGEVGESLDDVIEAFDRLRGTGAVDIVPPPGYEDLTYWETSEPWADVIWTVGVDDGLSVTTIEQDAAYEPDDYFEEPLRVSPLPKLFAALTGDTVPKATNVVSDLSVSERVTALVGSGEPDISGTNPGNPDTAWSMPKVPEVAWVVGEDHNKATTTAPELSDSYVPSIDPPRYVSNVYKALVDLTGIQTVVSKDDYESVATPSDVRDALVAILGEGNEVEIKDKQPIVLPPVQDYWPNLDEVVWGVEADHGNPTSTYDYKINPIPAINEPAQDDAIYDFAMELTYAGTLNVRLPPYTGDLTLEDDYSTVNEETEALELTLEPLLGTKNEESIEDKQPAVPPVAPDYWPDTIDTVWEVGADDGEPKSTSTEFDSPGPSKDLAPFEDDVGEELVFVTLDRRPPTTAYTGSDDFVSDVEDAIESLLDEDGTGKIKDEQKPVVPVSPDYWPSLDETTWTVGSDDGLPISTDVTNDPRPPNVEKADLGDDVEEEFSFVTLDRRPPTKDGERLGDAIAAKVKNETAKVEGSGEAVITDKQDPVVPLQPDYWPPLGDVSWTVGSDDGEPVSAFDEGVYIPDDD